MDDIPAIAPGVWHVQGRVIKEGDRALFFTAGHGWRDCTVLALTGPLHDIVRVRVVDGSLETLDEVHLDWIILASDGEAIPMILQRASGYHKER